MENRSTWAALADLLSSPVKLTVGAVSLAMLLALAPSAALAQDEYGYGASEEEWYDPSDWFDGDEIDYEDEYEYGYDEDEWFEGDYDAYDDNAYDYDDEWGEDNYDVYDYGYDDGAYDAYDYGYDTYYTDTWYDEEDSFFEWYD